MGLNFIDILILLISTVFLYKSFRKGFTGEVFGLLAIIISIVLSIKFNPFLTHYASKYIQGKNVASIVSFVASFIFLNILIRKIGTTIKKFLEVIYLGWVDSLAGIVIGGLKSIALCTIILFGLKMVPFANMNKAINQSQLAPHIQKISSVLIEIIKKNFPKELNKKYLPTTAITRAFFSK